MAALLISEGSLLQIILLGKRKSICHVFDMPKILYIAGAGCPLTKTPKTFPQEIDESLSLGLDLGVGSCGQALVIDEGSEKRTVRDMPELPGRICFLGVRAFDVPETNEKTGVKLKNPERRQKKHLRVTTRRRAWRLWEVKKLLKLHNLLPSDYPTNEALWKKPPPRGENPAFDKWRDWHSRMTAGEKGKVGPWAWRVKGLDEMLAPPEWAACLLHIAKHRGFKSNRKAEAAEDEGGKVLTALHENKEKLLKYRTVAEMFFNDDGFRDRKRNRAGSYTNMILRKDQENETHLLFETQRKLGNPYATEEFEKAFLDLYNRQFPLQNPVNLLGACPFEDGQKRGPRFSPSFELCRALQRLNTFALLLPDGQKVRFADHVDAANGGYQPFIDAFSTFAGTSSIRGRITWRDLRHVFDLGANITFADLPSPKKTTRKDGSETIQSITSLEGEDFLTRSTSNGAAKGSFLLRQAIGEDLWNHLSTNSPEQLDQAAHALTFFEEIENKRAQPEFWGVLDQMKHDGLNTSLIEAVEKDLRSANPTLHKFKGTTSMSTLASRKLIPLLEKGIFYSDACANLYGDHRQTDFAFQNITNPVVKSVVREVIKQVIHLIDETGKIPGRICVELSRDLGKSVKERNEIKSEIDKRTNHKNANRDRLAKVLTRSPDDDELLRYELWLEQSNTCPYCGESLTGNLTHAANSNDFQIDHIIPRSRSHDNSYDNKVLVHTHCNQHKTNRTPFEHFGQGNTESDSWHRLTATIDSMKRSGLRKHKARLLLNTTFADDEAKFARRHLNDTRHISRLVTAYLTDIYRLAGEDPDAKGAIKRVFVQPGQMTSIVRKAWGLENLKKDRNGNRLGDKHHAVDALVCALLSESQRQFITRLEQKKRDAASTAFASFSRSYELMEHQGDSHSSPRRVDPPWKTFRSDVVAALDLFTVSRREIRKGRGSLHNDTLYKVVKQDDGTEICYSRKPLVESTTGKAAFTTLADLEKIKGWSHERNQWLRDTLTTWVNAGAPTAEDLLPRDPQGTPIHKVTVSMGKKSGRRYPQGYVTGGNQVRLDVFSKTNPKGIKNYYLVPIYSYHLSQEHPPNRAIVANKEEEEWDEIDDDFAFEFSLWTNSRVEIKKAPTKKKPHGEQFIGLFKGTDRATGSFQLANPDDIKEQLQFTAKTGTLLFRKIQTDRLGREYIVKNEKRTWRGKTLE